LNCPWLQNFVKIIYTYVEWFTDGWRKYTCNLVIMSEKRLYLRQNGGDILTSSFMNSWLQNTGFTNLRVQVHEFNSSTSWIHEFNLMNSWSWNCEYTKLKQWSSKHEFFFDIPHVHLNYKKINLHTRLLRHFILTAF
jgi:hypothetical protein